MILAQAQLRCRAHHALRLDPAHLALGNLEIAGERGADNGRGHLVAHLHVLGTADDLGGFLAAHVGAANHQLVCIGVRID